MAHPLLVIEPAAAPYWDALNRGELTFQRCRPCGNAQLPPRVHCTKCLSDDLVWEQAAGTGRLVSWTTYHVAFNEYFRDSLPYTVAIVRLDEGPNLLTQLVNSDSEDFRAGQFATLVIEEEEGQSLARFRVDMATGASS